MALIFERVLLFLGMIFGLICIPFGLPGVIIILGFIFIYALATHFADLDLSVWPNFSALSGG